MSKACLYTESQAHGVQSVSSLENVFKSRQALVVQGIADVVSIQPFIIEMENWTTKRLRIPKKMKVAMCSAALTSMEDLQ